MRFFQKYRQELCTVISVIIFSFVSLSMQSNKPFIGHHDWNSAWYGAVVRNNTRYGVTALRFGNTSASGPIDIASTSYHVSYTPVFPLLLTIGVKLIGFSDQSLRQITISFSMISLIFLYLFIRQLIGKSAATIGLILYSVLPIFRYFSLIPVHETIVMPFIFSALFGYVWMRQKPTFAARLWYLLSIAFAFSIAWPVFALPILIYIHNRLTQKNKISMTLLSAIGMTIIVFIIYAVHIVLLSHTLHSLIAQILSRVTSDKTVVQDISFVTYIRSQIRYIRIYFTDVPIIAALLWGGNGVYQWIRTKKISSFTVLGIVLAVFSVSYALLFLEVAIIHDYFVIYMVPFFITISSYVLTKMLHNVANKSLLLAALLFVAVIGISYWRRNPYVHALYTSNHSEKGYRIGLFINQHTNFYDRAFIGSAFYKQFYDVFIGYYADRHVSFGNSIDQESIRDYQFIVRPRAHDALDPMSKEFLEDNYVHHENEEYIWYDTRESMKTQ